MTSVLFVCVGNTCRSVMAEFLARRCIDADARFQSAGLRPQMPEDAENAIESLSQIGIDASGHIPRDVWQLDLASFDRIIAMDNFVARQLRERVSVPDLEIWRISDPWGDDLEQYSRTLRQVQRQILRLKSELT